MLAIPECVNDIIYLSSMQTPWLVIIWTVVEGSYWKPALWLAVLLLGLAACQGQTLHNNNDQMKHVWRRAISGWVLTSITLFFFPAVLETYENTQVNVKTWSDSHSQIWATLACLAEVDRINISTSKSDALSQSCVFLFSDHKNWVCIRIKSTSELILRTWFKQAWEWLCITVEPSHVKPQYNEILS